MKTAILALILLVLGCTNPAECGPPDGQWELSVTLVEGDAAECEGAVEQGILAYEDGVIVGARELCTGPGAPSYDLCETTFDEDCLGEAGWFRRIGYISQIDESRYEGEFQVKFADTSLFCLFETTLTRVER